MKHFHYDTVSSTNDVTREHLDKNELVMVTADFQTDGRGRNDKKWHGSKDENLYCSIGVTHKIGINPDKIVLFQAIGTLSVKRTLVRLTNKNYFRIKYPNDVMASTEDGKLRKISGVLAENSFLGNNCLYTIIGIGVNVDQLIFDKSINEKAVSLNQLGIALDKKELPKLISESFEELNKLNESAIFSIWKDELKIEGKEIKLHGSNQNWIADKLLRDGRLKLLSPDSLEEKIIDNGDSIEYEY